MSNESDLQLSTKNVPRLKEPEEPNSLKLGLFGLHRGSSVEPDALARRARRAEELGFESLWLGDHVALPVSGQSSARNDPFEPRLEALTTLAFLAAATRRVRLAIGVLVLPQRQPVLLAKQLSTIDVLSSGRLIVGIGVGYLEDELRALGASMEDRGARTKEYLMALRALWRLEPASFAGRFLAFDGIVQRPAPVQWPHPPLVFGGQSQAAYRRTVQIGHGWHGFGLDLTQTTRVIAELQDAVGRYGRPAGLPDLEITITPPAGLVSVDDARHYADLGVHRLALQPASMEGAAIDDLIEAVGQTLVGKL